MREKLRCYGPMFVAVVFLGAAYMVPPVVSYVLTILAFVLIFEGGLTLYERVSRAGSMKDFRQ